MVEKQISSVLSQMGDLWNEPAKVKKQVEDGSYAARFIDMGVGLSQNSGRLQVTSQFEILAPEKYEGQKLQKFDGLETTDGVGYFKGYATVIGLELPTSPDGLLEAIEAFKASDNFKKAWTVVLRTSNGFTNIFVNGLAELVCTKRAVYCDAVLLVEHVEFLADGVLL